MNDFGQETEGREDGLSLIKGCRGGERRGLGLAGGREEWQGTDGVVREEEGKK